MGRYIFMNFSGFVWVRTNCMAFVSNLAQPQIWVWLSGNFGKFLNRPGHHVP